MNYISFIIPLLAGLSTIIGYLPTYISLKYQNTVIGTSLALSSGVMISISFLSLLKEAFSLLNNSISSILLIIIYFLCGGLLLTLIELIFPKKIENQLYKIGLISFGSLLLHNIPEGITTYLATKTSVSLGLSLALAIAFHNIPEGIMISIPIYYASKSHRKAFFYTLFASLSEFFGAVLASLFIKTINNKLLIFLLSLTAGIMTYLSVFELLPKSLSYITIKKTILSFILGVILIIICVFILK